MDADGSAVSCNSKPEEPPQQLQQPPLSTDDTNRDIGIAVSQPAGPSADVVATTTTATLSQPNDDADPLAVVSVEPAKESTLQSGTIDTVDFTESNTSSTSLSVKRKLPTNVDEHGTVSPASDAVEDTDDLQKVSKRSRLLTKTDGVSGNNSGGVDNGSRDELDELDDDDFDEDDDEEFEIERQRRKVSVDQGFPKGYESDVNDSFDEEANDANEGRDRSHGNDKTQASASSEPVAATLSLSDILPDVAGIADDVDDHDDDNHEATTSAEALAAAAAASMDDDDLARQMLQDANNPQKRRKRRRRRQRPSDDALAADGGQDGDDPNDGDEDAESRMEDGEVDMDYELTQKLKDMGEISVSKADGKHRTRGSGAEFGGAELGDEVSLELSSSKGGGGDADTEDKRKITNLRKNIREVMDDNQLDASTLAAQRQELDRLARVQEQQRMIRDAQRQIAMERQNSKMQNRVLSLLQGKSTSLLKGLTDVDATGASSSASAVSAAADAASVADFSNRTVNLTPSVSIAPVRGTLAANLSIAKRDPLDIDSSPEATTELTPDTALRLASDESAASITSRVQTSDSVEIDTKLGESSVDPLSSKPSASTASTATIIDDDGDEDMDEDGIDDEDMDDGDDDGTMGIDGSTTAASSAASAKKDVVHIVDSSDDDCIMLSDDEDEPEDTDDPHNSGLHVNDAYNVPDDQNRVVVNIGHPDGEEDIFVAPQIARIMKPHQIGGVRFLFDNIIESVERFSSSTGFGCILAHSMGLGKTLQLVCFCDIFLRHTEAKTVLCIMPINTLQNWMAEFNMWLPEEADKLTSRAAATGCEVRSRNFNLFVLNDTHKTLHARAKVVLDWSKNGGVLLMGYELYRLLSMKKVTKKRGRKVCSIAGMGWYKTHVQ